MTESIDEGARWSLSTRIALRFGALYWLLYIFPFPVNEWWPKAFGKAYGDGWTSTMRWTAGRVFGLVVNIPPGPNGSGDTTLDWVMIPTYAALAASGTLVWFALERRRQAYPVLHGWLRILLRYFLGVMMLSYGSYKVIKLQFPAPDPARLAEAYGDTSPMGLLWTFMGSSKLYTFFGGAAEILGGVLLLFRRTTTLGALVLVGVMGNVFTLNLAYDVPVKQFSGHLLLIAVVLLLPDVRRLLAFFLQLRVVPPARPDPPFRWRRAAAVVKVAVIGWFVYTIFADAVKEDRERGDDVPPSTLAGVYEVAPCDACPDWRQIAIGSYKGGPRILAYGPDGEMRRYGTEILGNVLELKAHRFYRDRTPVIEHELLMVYEVGDAGVRELRGHWHGRRFVAALRRIDRRFLLVDRGFHWINEYPLNL